ncbi:universal stress protein [Kineosporia sp. A_224]|uniref:universal stress protein n=1 Tax=Kineosporia sp. A_224 TaxID=1962180 RepID=UPI000B4BFF29|nr:universal stress protein [Kineosporia sp. A_224]
MDETVEPWAAVPTIEGGIVVGSDGSRGAASALDWALDDADRRGCAVHVVRTWMLATAIDDVPGEPGSVPSMPECAAVTRRLAEADVAATVAARGSGTPPEVVCHAVHGPAGPTLVAVAADADLLVVGHRGRGHLADLLLGSVAEYALRHATCPVVVVRR